MNYPDWTRGVHHDGSALYVSNPLPTLNENVTITLRVPADAPLDGVYLRTEPDGEQHFAQMNEERRDNLCVFYTADLTMRNRRMTYRFKLLTAMGAFYYTAIGISRADKPDHSDFKLVADFEFPSWLQDAVFYQIFPDRFYNSSEELNPVEGEKFVHPPFEPFETQMRGWDDQPLPFEQAGNVDFFGGDLPGITQKLPYLQSLGVTALYLNPIFKSRSNHRYNIADFFAVDEALGGDEALVELREALDEADMRYVLDLTPNHSGDDNAWFSQAQADPTSPEASFYTFYDGPQDYETWLGIATLPKLNYASELLRRRMYRDEDSVMQYWLRPPYRADGWRLDVWNMTARQGVHEPHHEVGQEMRVAVKGVSKETYLFGEHFFDSSPSLQGDQMDAAMNYQGFSFPVWRWLAGHDLGAWNKSKQSYTDKVPMPAEAAAEQMTAFMAVVPWAVTRMQFNQLGSHDTPRILTVVDGNEALARMAAVILFTFPGVPCVYYGDEIGMAGGRDPDNRRPMQWDKAKQNTEMLALYQQLIELRRTHPALIDGGFQFLHAADNLLAYQREAADERILFIGNRAGDDLRDVRIPVRHGGIGDDVIFTDVLTNETFHIRDGHLELGHIGAWGVHLLVNNL